LPFCFVANFMKILRCLLATFLLVPLGVFAQSGGPTYPIGLVRGNNSVDGGVADSLNVRCKLVGVLYGKNFRASNGGIQFSLRDNTGWIGLFRDNSNFGLSLEEGDSVRAIGQITQFNGLSQLSLDSIRVLAKNRPLVAPLVVTNLDENTESRLVKVEGWQITNPSAWTPGQGSGFTVRIKKGNDSLELRIDNDCPWFTQPIPTGILDILGLGGQFDASVPRNSGYQLLPRFLSDIFVQGTPLKANFIPNSGSVTENAGSVSISVSLNIPNSNAVPIQVAVKGGSASPGSDYTFASPQTLTFNTNQSSISFPVTLINNMVAELPETIEFVLRPANGSPAGIVGNDSIFTLTIADDDGSGSVIPTYAIGVVRGNNGVQGGLPDSLGRYCRLRGILYGSNLRGPQGGHQFTLRDQTGGISVFTTVTQLAGLGEGDSIQVVGRIEHFQGLGTLRIDSLRRFSTGNPLKNPRVVQALNETTESDFIRLLGFQLVNPAEWTTGQGSGGFTVRIYKGTDTLRLRVDSETSLYFDPAPSGVFNVTGLGSQFDLLAPFNTGYEIVPRGSADIQLTQGNPPVAFTNASQNANESAGTIQIPVKLLSAGSSPASVQVAVKGGTASNGSDYIFSSSPTLNFAPGSVTASLEITLIDDNSQEGDETLILVLRVGSGVALSNDSLFTLTIVDNDQPGAFVPTYSIGTIRGNNSIDGGVADSSQC
jgi:DNA/RNA endonuclease YhcR with UshA esterase domain